MAPARKMVAARVRQQAPGSSGMGGQMMKQLAMMPIMYFASQIEWDKQKIFILEAVFLTFLAVSSVLIQLALLLVNRKQEKGRVVDAGDAMLFLDASALGADGSMSIQDYDSAKLKVSRMQVLISGTISWFVHTKWETQTPLLMVCVVVVMQLWDCKALAIHLLGIPHKRPWDSSAPSNPLASWAQKQKKEEAKELRKAEKEATGGKQKIKGKPKAS